MTVGHFSGNARKKVQSERNQMSLSEQNSPLLKTCPQLLASLSAPIIEAAALLNSAASQQEEI